MQDGVALATPLYGSTLSTPPQPQVATCGNGGNDPATNLPLVALTQPLTPRLAVQHGTSVFVTPNPRFTISLSLLSNPPKLFCLHDRQPSPNRHPEPRNSIPRGRGGRAAPGARAAGRGAPRGGAGRRARRCPPPLPPPRHPPPVLPWGPAAASATWSPSSGHGAAPAPPPAPKWRGSPPAAAPRRPHGRRAGRRRRLRAAPA